jgi:molecular chaperone GrpE (heat shock protein)
MSDLERDQRIHAVAHLAQARWRAMSAREEAHKAVHGLYAESLLPVLDNVICHLENAADDLMAPYDVALVLRTVDESAPKPASLTTAGVREVLRALVDVRAAAREDER